MAYDGERGVTGHLRRMADNNVSVHAICNGTYYPGCKVVSSPDPEADFGIIVKGGAFSAEEKLSVSYVFSPFMYTFEANIMGALTNNLDDVLIRIRTPGKIARLERRKWERIKPSEQRPVVIALVRDGNTVLSHASELSLSGIGFSLPRIVSRLIIGSRIPMTLSLPRLGSMEAVGVVRTVREAPGTFRYGAQFDPVPEFDSLLSQYLYLRKAELRAEYRSSPSLRKESVVVLMKDTGQGRYAFLCSDSPVNRAEDFNSFAEIVSVDVMDFLEDRPQG